MRVMGIDPGLTRCGVAIVDVASTRRVSVISAHLISTATDRALGERLLALEEGFELAVEQYRPDVCAIERVFSQHNVRTIAGTAQAAGVAALVAARHALVMSFRTPTEVKAAVTGSGSADKRQVANMIHRIAGAPIAGPADVTDAVAIAICEGWRGYSAIVGGNRQGRSV